MGRDDIFCEWENDRFPSDQFDRDPVHGLVHERRPDPSSPRHTAMGDDLGGGGGGGGGDGGDGGGGGRKSRGGGAGFYRGAVYAPWK